MSKIRLATILDPSTNCLHIDDPAESEPTYGSIVMDIDKYMSALGGKSKAASTASLNEIFFNTQDEENGIAAEDWANEYYDKIAQSRAAVNKSRTTR